MRGNAGAVRPLLQWAAGGLRHNTDTGHQQLTDEEHPQVFCAGVYSFDIVGFLDTTLLKTGREGYLFTVDGVYYKEFLEKPGHFRYNDVAKTEIILPKPKDNGSTLEIRFQNGRWVRWGGYSLYKTAAKRLLDGLCEIAARYPDEDDEDEA